MKLTVEISKYPLSEAYESKILDFIARLNQYEDIVVKTNDTSTQVSGEFDFLSNIVAKEIKISYEKYGKAIFVVKYLLGDLLDKHTD